MKNVTHLKYRMIYGALLEKEDLVNLVKYSDELVVRTLAVEKLRAVYENQIMTLEGQLYDLTNEENN